MARKKQAELTTSVGLPPDYAELLQSLEARVRQAQTRAVLSENRELICLYWDIGREIVQRQEQAGWGRSVVERLADDIQRSFSGIGGFSRPNVFRMRVYYLGYRSEFIPQAVGQTSHRIKVPQPVRRSAEAGPPAPMANVPWGHNVQLIERVKDEAERLWYAAKALEHGWSRAVLTVQIETGLIGR